MRVARGILSLIFVLTLILRVEIGLVNAASTQPSVVISEVSMGTEDSASDEFVELYNNSPTDINLIGWSLYYKSSTGKTWTKKASIAQDNIIHAHDYFLLASVRPEADLPMTSGMSQTSGIIQLKDSSGSSIDLVGWGSADTFETQAASSPQAGEVLYRQFDISTQTMLDNDINFDDFNISANETLKAQPVVELPTPDVTQSYPKISLSELFPNPASPQEDSTDEFIELYNPNNQDISLSGWILKDAGGTSYILKDKVIPKLGYLSIYSSESSLSLNNSGDVIYLYSPDSGLVDSSADYGDANEGLSWATVGDSWDWTVNPTPSTTNSSAYVETDVSKPAAAKTTAKKVTAKKASTKAANKSSAAKAKKPASSGTSNQQDPQSSAANSSSSLIWSWLLIALGVGTIGYGIYEYRPEIIGAYHRLANKFKTRS